MIMAVDVERHNSDSVDTFISPQFGISYKTSIPSCGSDSSIHASQYKHYEIDWHLYRPSGERLQHKFNKSVPR